MKLIHLIYILGVIQICGITAFAEEKLKIYIPDNLIDYPRKLANEGISGEVLARAHITKDGTVLDILWLEASHELFGEAVEEGLRGAKVKLSTDDTDILAYITVNFDTRGVMITNSSSHYVGDVFIQGRHSVKNTVKASQLPEGLKISSVQQRYRVVDESGKPYTGSVVIRYFVDKDGSVRFPTIERLEGDPEIADAAVQTLMQTQFEPPALNEKGEAIEVIQEFIYR